MSIEAIFTPQDGVLDPFSRMRVSEGVTLFDSTMQHDEQPLLYETVEQNNATSTWLEDESAVRLRATDDANSNCIRQSREYFRYQPGRGQLIFMTFQMIGDIDPTLIKLVGYTDEDDGIFVAQYFGEVVIGLRSSTTGSKVERLVEQSLWNLDTFDGSRDSVRNPSGIQLDLSKAQILVIDLQWLGVGRVRVGFDIDGEVHYAHEFKHANSGEGVYMRTANLPVRWQVYGTGGAVSATNDILQICAAVISEGGAEDDRMLPFSASNGATDKAVDGQTPLISVRLKTTFNGVTNRVTIVPRSVSVLAVDQPIFVEVIYNGTLGGTDTWVSANDESAVEYSITHDGISDGVVVDSFFIPASATGNRDVGGAIAAQLASKLPLSLSIGGTNPTSLTVAATNISTTTTASATIGWKEGR